MLDRNKTDAQEYYTDIQADRHRLTRGLDRQKTDLIEC